MSTYGYILRRYNVKDDVIEIPDVDRTDLAKLFNELGFKVGAEIGIAAGWYSSVIMANNPQLERMYGVDPHEPYRGYHDYVRTSTFANLIKEAHQRLDKYAPVYQFVRKYSMDALGDFEDGSLDFVYIDANHKEPYVSQDINAWPDKVRKGGIVAGDDYARVRGKDGQPSDNWAVIPAIKKYTSERNIPLFIWGLEAKLPGLKRDSGRSWMFVKP